MPYDLGLNDISAHHQPQGYPGRMHAPDTQEGTPSTAPAQGRSRLHARERKRLAVLREGRAVDLRLLGMTYEQVAASLLPCSSHRGTEGDPTCSLCQVLYPGGASAARKAILRALDKAYALGQEGREQLRQQQLGQIDLLLRKAMRSAMGGDWEAARVATRLLDRRARLLGLDAPSRVQVTTELDQEIEALLDQLAEQTGSREAAEQVLDGPA